MRTQQTTTIRQTENKNTTTQHERQPRKVGQTNKQQSPYNNKKATTNTTPQKRCAQYANSSAARSIGIPPRRTQTTTNKQNKQCDTANKQHDGQRNKQASKTSNTTANT